MARYWLIQKQTNTQKGLKVSACKNKGNDMARLLARMNAFNFTKVFFNPKLQVVDPNLQKISHWQCH